MNLVELQYGYQILGEKQNILEISSRSIALRNSNQIYSDFDEDIHTLVRTPSIGKKVI